MLPDQYDVSGGPTLRFTPTAWAKLLYFRDRGPTEVGGFGITSATDLLLIDDFVTITQDVSVASVSFDDQAVAEFFDSQVDAGRKPEQFGRIWVHTHPGDSSVPRGTDEETFRRVFGGCQWAIMFILAAGGDSYARLRFNIGPGGQSVIPVEVDYSRPFGPSEQNVWEAEYTSNIKGLAGYGLAGNASVLDYFGGQADLSGYTCPEDWLEDLEAMEPAERQAILDELGIRPDLWEEREEVLFYD